MGGTLVLLGTLDLIRVLLKMQFHGYRTIAIALLHLLASSDGVSAADSSSAISLDMLDRNTSGLLRTSPKYENLR